MAAEPAAVAAAYDFSQFETIIDVGGATGNLLTAILGRHCGPRGILFDLPHVVRDAPALTERGGLMARISVEAANFFEKCSRRGEAYVLSRIIHDWGEAQCLTILDNCRCGMKPDGRLLIIEMVLPTGDAPHPGVGRERYVVRPCAADLSSGNFALAELHRMPPSYAVTAVSPTSPTVR